MRRPLVALVLVPGLVLAAAPPRRAGPAATSAHRQVVVHAPRDLVWRLLTDFDGYSRGIRTSRGRGERPRRGDRHASARAGRGRAGGLRVRGDGRQGTAQAALALPKYGVPGLLDREHAFREASDRPRDVWLVYDGRLEGILEPFTDLDD